MFGLGAPIVSGKQSSESAMKITHEDFKRSDRFLLGSARDTWNGDIAWYWLDKGASLAYKHQDAKGTEFRKVQTHTRRMEPLMGAELPDEPNLVPVGGYVDKEHRTSPGRISNPSTQK
jgi:hypothetical protein